jgi:hypothetical protein
MRLATALAAGAALIAIGGALMLNFDGFVIALVVAVAMLMTAAAAARDAQQHRGDR